MQGGLAVGALELSICDGTVTNIVLVAHHQMSDKPEVYL